MNEKPGPALIFLATPTREMMPIFKLEPLAHQTIIQLRRAADEFDAMIYGYSLIPSSLFALVGFHGNYDLAAFVYKFKWLSSRAMIGLDHGEFHQRLFRKGKFKPWMNRFDNLTVSSVEQFESKLNYIHNEPVRRELVSEPGKWNLSSAGDYMENRPGLIEIARDVGIFKLL